MRRIAYCVMKLRDRIEVARRSRIDLCSLSRWKGRMEVEVVNRLFDKQARTKFSVVSLSRASEDKFKLFSFVVGFIFLVEDF